MHAQPTHTKLAIQAALMTAIVGGRRAFFLQVDSIEVVRAYGNMLRLVLERGKLLQQLQSAIAALQKAAEVHAEVPVVLEAACHKIKERVTAVDGQIQVRPGPHTAAG
jgi:predicted metal-dependent hydrolase